MHQSLGRTSWALQQQEGRKMRTAPQILHHHHSKHLQEKASTAQGHSEQAAIPKRPAAPNRLKQVWTPIQAGVHIKQALGKGSNVISTKHGSLCSQAPRQRAFRCFLTNLSTFQRLNAGHQPSNKRNSSLQVADAEGAEATAQRQI